MEFSRGRRIVIVLLLLFTLSALLVVGGIDRPPAPELGVYPGADDIAQQPEEYQNQQVSFVGQIVSTDPVTVRAEYETDTGIESIRVELTDIETPVDRDDRLQVFGVLTTPRIVRTTNVVVAPQTGLWYAWITSFVAGLWVLARILRHWTLDIEIGAFLPRLEALHRREGDE
jgi:hypothetical protein